VVFEEDPGVVDPGVFVGGLRSRGRDGVEGVCCAVWRRGGHAIRGDGVGRAASVFGWFGQEVEASLVGTGDAAAFDVAGFHWNDEGFAGVDAVVGPETVCFFNCW